MRPASGDTGHPVSPWVALLLSWSGWDIVMTRQRIFRERLKIFLAFVEQFWTLLKRVQAYPTACSHLLIARLYGCLDNTPVSFSSSARANADPTINSNSTPCQETSIPPPKQRSGNNRSWTGLYRNQLELATCHTPLRSSRLNTTKYIRQYLYASPPSPATPVFIDVKLRTRWSVFRMFYVRIQPFQRIH